MNYAARTLRLFSLITTLWLATVATTGVAHAAQIETREYFKGMFIAETTAGNQYYWYVHPETRQRFALSDSEDFSRLLKKVGGGISTNDLLRIPEAGAVSASPDYDFVATKRGKILIAVENSGRAWYVNPIDNTRHYLANGKEGFAVIQQLAVDVRPDRLELIPITLEIGFNELTYTSDHFSPDGADFGTYDSVFDTLRKNHLFKNRFTDADLLYGSLKGMAEATTDPNTQFFTPKENEQTQQAFFGDQSIEGIGSIISDRDGTIYIVSVLKNAPAERAGLKSQDEIKSIDGVSARGVSVEAAVGRIKGPSGTAVVLTIFRPLTGDTFDVKITRERISVPLVSSQTFDDGTIAYFQISLFNANIVNDFLKAMNGVVTNQTKGIIVDLRNNVGGVTRAAQVLADIWLTSGQRIFTERRPEYDLDYLGTSGRLLPAVPTIILTNGETASASEIFSQALRYHGAAKLLGTKTYGKGTGQTLTSFKDGSAVKYTTFEWLTPDGSTVDGVGLTPDYFIQESLAGDAQLDRARELILYQR